MYQVSCDGFPLLDFRDKDLILFNPKVKVEVNTVGEGSFTIYKNHPYFDKIKRLKSIVEVRDEIGAIFRGRMTDNTIDFDNGKAVDLEGLMAFFNDSIIAPYNFPEDFLNNADYIAAAESGNVVEFFLNWLIENHNSQVAEFQQFKLGEVTVSDPNNYITRSDSDHQHTWDILKTKLFESALGGFLCIRYEEDGNYIDYLSEFTLTNTQEIEFGKNLVDLKQSTKGSETYSAIIPFGAEIEVETGETDEEGNAITEKKKLTLASIPDGEIAEDIEKVTLPNGLHAIYSKSAVDEYGWICPKPSETTWDDVTDVDNLLTKSVEYLGGTAVMLEETVEFTAADLHFTDNEIRSFRIYRNVIAKSTPHNLSKSYPLTKLEIPLLEPQNTKITVGETVKTLTGETIKHESETIQRIETAEKDIETNRADVTETKKQIFTQSTEVINTCNEIILGALKSYVEKGNGVTVSAVARYYLASSLGSGVTVDLEGWSESIPTLTETDFNLWTYEEVKYSDDSIAIKEPHILATYNSSEITSIVEYYGVNSYMESPVIIDENGEEVEIDWVQSIPNLSAGGLYLWNYTVISYSNGDVVETEKKVIGSYSYSFNELAETVSAQLIVLADRISMNFETTSTDIKDVNGDLQQTIKKLEKHFDFSLENGLIIRAGENEMKLRLDNDVIGFYKGEINESNLAENRFGWWDGVDFHTGNIVVNVEERAQFGNFAFVPRSDGSLSFLKVGS